jgi:hypothetical protein
METEKNLQAAIPSPLLTRAHEVARQERIDFDELIASAVEQRVSQHDFQGANTDERPIWEVITDIVKDVPDEVFDRLPKDAASQVDHYIYGLPKRD